MQSSFQRKKSPEEEKALEEIKKIRDLLIEEDYIVDEPVKKEYNYEVNIAKGKSKVKLLVYFGKKGIKKVLQGNVNSEIYKKIDSIINMTFNFDEPEIQEPENYIGTDESGKGDFFGPLIVAAFAYDKTLDDKLTKLNIRDSKEISDSEIKSISSVIRRQFRDRIAVVEIHPAKYNQLYESFQNLNKILIWSHSKAIEEVRKRHNYNTFIIDKFCQEDLIKNELNKNQKDYNLILTEKAERFKGVAIASIIARERLLSWFEKKRSELKIDLPLGASEKVNNVASHIRDNFGKEFLKGLVKLHFKNLNML